MVWRPNAGPSAKPGRPSLEQWVARRPQDADAILKIGKYLRVTTRDRCVGRLLGFGQWLRELL